MSTRNLILTLLAVHIIVCEFNVQSFEEMNFNDGTVIINVKTIGKHLINSMISVVTDVHVDDCAEECMRRPRCLSVNYERRFLLCELNLNDTSKSEEYLIVKPSSVYIEKKDMEEVSFGACSSKECRLNEQCREDVTGLAKCVISDCGIPTTVHNADFNTSHGIGVYSKVTYRCRENTCLDGKPYIGCQETGFWSPIRFTCRDACPAGWSHFESSCYYIDNTQVTWYEAKSYCESQTAYLAEITSPSEESFIGILSHWTIWIGGTDEGTEGNWRWSNSNSLIAIGTTGKTAYTNWGRTEPNGNENENCLVRLAYIGTWADASCSGEQGFVCEQSKCTAT